MIRRTALLAALGFGLAVAGWVGIGPFGAQVYSGAMSASDPQTFYLSPHIAPTRLLKTTDGGTNWTQTAQLGYFAFGMAVHPTDPNTVIAAAGALYRTTNGGDNWTYCTVPGGSYAQAVAFHPTDPQQAIAVGYNYAGYAHMGSYRTTNGGANWDTLGLDTMQYSMGYSVCYDPVDPTIVYAGGYNGQPTYVFKSTDGGASWQRLATGFNGYYCYALHVSPLDHDIVIASSYNTGIIRSTDAGATWSQVATYRPIYTFAAVAGHENIIYAGTDNYVYASRDTGRTWQPVASQPGGIWCRTVLPVPGDTARLFAASKAGCFRSTDAGASWQSMLGEVAAARVPAMALSPAEPQGLWVEYEDDAVYRTTDNGSSWTRCPDFLSCGNICGMAVDPRDPLVVWALEGSG